MVKIILIKMVAVCRTRILCVEQLPEPPDPDGHRHRGEGLRWQMGRDAREGEGKGGFYQNPDEEHLSELKTCL